MHGWALDPDILQLNHGSFGARLRQVLDVQQRWRERMEANPTGFVMDELPAALDEVRSTLAGFVGADPAGLALVPNATSGVAAVLRSLEPDLGPGDEIVVTDHGYNACRNAAESVAARTGAVVVTATVPFPIESPAEVVAAVTAAVTDRTRLVMVDHVTSTTALVLPVADLVAALDGVVPVLVDGAHAPGMVPLDLDDLGAAFYTGNCHKWLCAPPGAGFLHVGAGYRERVEPAVISHGWTGDHPVAASRYHRMFDWTGTDDASARLAVPAAIAAVGALHPDGWPGVRDANRDLAIAGRNLLCDALGVEPAAPDTMIGSMATIPLAVLDGPAPLNDPLAPRLRREWKIEVPVFGLPSPPRRAVRISAQRYNTLDDYHRLAGALLAEQGRD